LINLFLDLDDITLGITDINDPHVTVELSKVPYYSRAHLIEWLKYGGDSLKGLDNMKHIRARVVQYHNNGTENSIVDPTPDFRWRKQKANNLGLKLHIPLTPITTTDIPEILRDKLGALKSTAGWTKSLEFLPKLTINDMEAYLNSVKSKRTLIEHHNSFQNHILIWILFIL